jgi:hypothetical protein
MVLGPTGWESATRPELVIDVVEDRYGLPFLLMHGCEPDTRWESFAEAVVVLAKTLGVKQALSMYGVPFPVPHTRPLTTTYPTTVELLTSHGSADHLQIPGSAAALVELRLNQANIPAHSATVQVPQYLAAMPYPPAAIALMDQLSRATGLQFDSSRLATDADVIARRIDSQVADIPEIKAMVEQLEARWEANRTERVLSAEQSLPSAEEIAAELENFLATQQTDEVDLFRNLTENMRREPRLRRGPARDSVLPQIPPLADQTDRNTDQADPGQLPATDPPAAS